MSEDYTDLTKFRNYLLHCHISVQEFPVNSGCNRFKRNLFKPPWEQAAYTRVWRRRSFYISPLC